MKNPSKTSLPTRRPPTENRTFRSGVVESAITEASHRIGDPTLAWLFENAFPNTLDTTVTFDDSGNAPDTFIVTGDIPAMWLRDSTAQVWPFLTYMKKDETLRRMIEGIIRRQAASILLDPYANAFYREPVFGEWKNDQTEMRPGVHERKWELDSPMYFLRLCRGYREHAQDFAPFDETWVAALHAMLDCLRDQQNDDHRYRFVRSATKAGKYAGRGNPSRFSGMVRSAYRPSDDACMFPFLVPSNAMAVVELRSTAGLCDELSANLSGVDHLADELRALADEIHNGIQAFGVVNTSENATEFAYEVDGFGSRLMMDDANTPSLLSLPYLGYVDVHDPIYQRTRARVLSSYNPYFVAGALGAGLGSPHVSRKHIWPMGLTMQAITSTDDQEIMLCLRLLVKAHSATGLLHEAFHVDNAADFTRPWFAWANTLFGELIMKLLVERPHLVEGRIE
jgi:meiotically up-regulated gene 157 (Mug157) protein